MGLATSIVGGYEPRYRVSAARAPLTPFVPASELVRCGCRSCGSHVHAVVFKQTISGVCGNCNSCDIARLPL